MQSGSGGSAGSNPDSGTKGTADGSTEFEIVEVDGDGVSEGESIDSSGSTTSTPRQATMTDESDVSPVTRPVESAEALHRRVGDELEALQARLLKVVTGPVRAPAGGAAPGADASRAAGVDTNEAPQV